MFPTGTGEGLRPLPCSGYTGLADEIKYTGSNLILHGSML